MEKDLTNGNLEGLLEYLKRTRGFDFGAYKRATLSRRIAKRMEVTSVGSCEEYQDYLEVHPEEFQQLFNTILINVTDFFRDDDAWRLFSAEIIPKVLQSKKEEDSVRAWVAGCASGEEAYTLAMVLAEELGEEKFRQRVKIYATDLDDDALNHSRTASYQQRDIEKVPKDLLEKYFQKVEGQYVFDRELRRSIIFGKHDLIQDAPISRVDLLLCRNTLMYFNAETQEKILSRFHFALNEGGYLFLGKAETLLTHSATFLPVDIKNRVFAKSGRIPARDRAFVAATPNPHRAAVVESQPRLRELALEFAPVAQIVVDTTGRLVLANERARATLGVQPKEIGRMFQDSEISYRPVELRSAIQQAYDTRRFVVYKEIRWSQPGSTDSIVLDIRVTPLFAPGGELTGASITFEDISKFKHLQEDLLNFNQELETAYEEVQSTNEELQTTNEELQSTIEELETTNEELQSTNEELETMNEELQSSNEELETINEELRTRSDELNQANAFLQSVLGSLSDGVIVVDRDLQVIGWNYKSEDQWGLRADEVKSKHLLNLDIGLPVDKLRPAIKACLGGAEREEVVLDTTNRRGKAIHCRILCSPLVGLDPEPRGVIMMIEDTAPVRA